MNRRAVESEVNYDVKLCIHVKLILLNLTLLKIEKEEGAER